MSSWAAGLAEHYGEVLDGMERTLLDCPDELWEASMWKVEWDDRWGPVRAPGLSPTDSEGREWWIQTRSAVWAIAHHALFCLDYDLSGGRGEWNPPGPFAEELWDYFPITRVYSRPELIAYVQYVKDRANRVLAALTDDDATAPIPAEHGHRYHGRTFAWLLLLGLQHVAEHEAQIRQFITDGSEHQDRR